MSTDTRKGPPTICKICWQSVFGADYTTWVTTPCPGLAHATCAREEPRTKK
jgi:hypothetical protein